MRRVIGEKAAMQLTAIPGVDEQLHMATQASYLPGDAPLIVAVQIRADCLSADALFVPDWFWVRRVAAPAKLAQAALAPCLRHTTFDLAFASLTVRTCYHRALISCL